MRKYRLPPIRDEPWDGDEKAKILVMNIYEMEVLKVPFYLQNFILCFTSILLGVLLLSITFVNRQKLLRALYLLSILRRWSFVDSTSHYLPLHDIIQKNKRYKRMDKGGERGCAKRRAA